MTEAEQELEAVFRAVPEARGQFERIRERLGLVRHIRVDIPHVWDVDGKPRGVCHELDGDHVVARDG